MSTFCKDGSIVKTIKTNKNKTKRVTIKPTLGNYKKLLDPSGKNATLTVSNGYYGKDSTGKSVSRSIGYGKNLTNAQCAEIAKRENTIEFSNDTYGCRVPFKSKLYYPEKQKEIWGIANKGWNATHGGTNFFTIQKDTSYYFQSSVPTPIPPTPVLQAPPTIPQTTTEQLKITKVPPVRKNSSEVADLLLDTGMLDPYNLETILNKQKIEDITDLLQNLIKGNNYLLYDINNNKLDIYNELNNHNKKLYQEIAKIFKKDTNSTTVSDIQMRQKISNILTIFLEKVLQKTNIQNTRIQRARGKETKQLENKQQLLERKIEYDIQDTHIKNTVLKYIRIVLYILVAILIVFCVINYIKT
jgi:hypothetical protein